MTKKDPLLEAIFGIGAIRAALGEDRPMKRKRYTDEQIRFALRQAESGTSVEEIYRRMGISEAAAA